MYFIKFNVAALFATAAIVSVSARTGWLDRVVEYHKQNFYKDVDKIAPVQINVKLEPVPHGYVDSTLWNYDSVMHLLVLISESETARPVRHALRRMMQPSRRYMSRPKSLKLFPSIMKSYKNDFYYDVPSSAEYVEPTFGYMPDDNAIIMVTNPVEARLPSSRISVKLLRDILDARAKAARQLPTTSRTTYSWKHMNKTAAPHGSGSGEGSGEGSGDGHKGKGEKHEGSGGENKEEGSGGEKKEEGSGGEKKEEGKEGEKKDEGSGGEKKEEGKEGEKKDEGSGGEKKEEGKEGEKKP